MSEVFETIMLICFGLSWPVSIYKSFISRTAKGKSVLFMIFLFIGYLCGIMSKLTGNGMTYVVYLYMLNSVLIFIDLLLYFRNKRIDKKNDN